MPKRPKAALTANRLHFFRKIFAANTSIPRTAKKPSRIPARSGKKKGKMSKEKIQNSTPKVNIEAPVPEKVVPGGIYGNPLSDEGFKNLLSSVSSLKSFLNGVMHLDAEREIKSLRFKTRRISFHTNDKDGDEKRTWCFDIRAQTKGGKAIDIEIQNLRHHFFDDRVLIYGSALMLKAKAELDKARADEDRKKVRERDPQELTPEEKSERRRQTYELPDTVCIWVCNFAVPRRSTATQDNWMLYSENDLMQGRLLPATNRIKYIFLQLPNFAKPMDKLDSVEDQWMYVLKHAFASTAEIDIENQAVTEALERIRFIETPKEEATLITKEEYECTIASIEYDAREEGIAQGREEARKEYEAEIAAKDTEIAALKALLKNK